MAVGKYSPTVSNWYMKSQTWFQLAPGEVLYDQDGFDSYGYNKDDMDRAGNHENDYVVGEWVQDEYCHPLYESVLEAWASKPLPY